VENPVALFAWAEADISVIVVRGGVVEIESPEPFEEVAANKKAGSRAEIDIADIPVLRTVPVVAPTVVPAGAVVPNDAAGFLQPAVRVEQPGADCPRGGIPKEGLEERLEPAVEHQGVIVQKQEPLTARGLGALVTRVDEPDILLVAQNVHAVYPGKHLGRPVARGVVHHDHLVA